MDIRRWPEVPYLSAYLRLSQFKALGELWTSALIYSTAEKKHGGLETNYFADPQKDTLFHPTATVPNAAFRRPRILTA